MKPLYKLLYRNLIMKNLNIFFELLLFPFIFLKNFSLFQRLSIPTQGEHTRVTTHSLKFLFVMPLLLSSLMTIQAVADIEPNNDNCGGEILTISSGLNTFTGFSESGGADYYQFTVPAAGNITITWTSDKTASLLVGTGTDCNGSIIYNGYNPRTSHDTNSTAVEEGDIIFIEINNGNNKAYTLTIDLEVDISGLVDEDYRKPTFCYEYYYTQGTTPLKETDPPRIEDNVTLGIDVDINLYIKNLGYIKDSNTSYRTAENVVVDIIDINATQAIYSEDGILVKQARVFDYEYIPNAELDVSDTYIKGIDIRDVGTMDSFSIQYQVTPQIENLNFPLNAKIAYDLAVAVGDTYVMTSHEIFLQDGNIPVCESNDTGYSPAYSIFNVELDSLNDGGPIYNLPTQTAMRADNFEIVSYKIDQVHVTNPTSTPVAIVLIDVINDDIETACANEDSAISPRIWISFTGTQEESNITRIDFNATTIANAITNGAITDQIYPRLEGEDPISVPGEFYSSARENVAFRVIYNALKDGDELIRLIRTKLGLRIDNFEELVQDITFCKQPVTNPKNQTITDRVSVACSNDGNNLSETELATCMECLYGYNTRYLCSRDNFAIRPESFRVSLSDQDQESPATQSHIKTNLDSNQIKIVAGYQYALEVNATNYLNDNSTTGYHQTFSEVNATADKRFSFVWSADSSINPSNCNDTSDHNKAMAFNNGALDSNLSNAQIGEYNLTIIDNLWTRHDYDPELLTHHRVHPVHGDVSAYFIGASTNAISGKDCLPDLTTVPIEGAPAATDGTNIINVSGCDIKSEHTRYDGTTGYTNINTRIYPYKFDLSDVIPAIGPYTRTNGQTFVYINTPPTMDQNNTNMSYNLNGTFFAAGRHDVGSLSNFVTGCYADDLNMSLNFSYNSPEPPATKAPYLSYSLKDHNITDNTVVYRPIQPGNDFEEGNHTSSTDPFSITQGEAFFAKEMKGAITMDLGYNFVRDYNKTLNPRYIEFHDFNITYVDDGSKPTLVKANLESDFQIFGDKILDHNVTFVYGRAKPSQDFYDDVTANFIDTPISIVVYCDQDPITCSAVYNIDTALGRTDEYNWYRLVAGISVPPMTGEHVTSENDGNITLIASTGASVAPNDSTAFPINFNRGVNNPDVRVTADTGTNRPLDIDINFGAATNRWLIYNEDNDSIPSPFYRVRFIGHNDWAGHGDTGHVVDNNVSTKKNRRLGW